MFLQSFANISILSRTPGDRYPGTKKLRNKSCFVVFYDVCVDVTRDTRVTARKVGRFFKLKVKS